MVFSGVFLKTFGGQRGFDDRREVAIGTDVADAGPSDQSGGEDAIGVGFLWFLDAVGGHQHRAGEFVELATLILPRTAVVAHQMLVFFQFGIAVARQHFAVRVDVDAFPFGLL
jgi:hypothetical protein